MNNIKLITDGSCDLSQEIINRYDINIISLNVNFGEENYIAGVEIDNETFYKKMKENKELPKTSCPSPDRFMNAYEGEEDVLVITLSSKLSATYSTAVLAKDMYSEESNKEIEVIDSMSGSIGAGLLVIMAANMIEKGKTLSEIKDRIESIKENIIMFGALATLENAIKGGRVSPIAGKIAGALNLKAIIQVTNGLVKPIDKARGENNSLNKIVSKLIDNTKNSEDQILMIAHANDYDKALKVKSMIEEKAKFREVLINEIGAVMGTYAAEGAILIATI